MCAARLVIGGCAIISFVDYRFVASPSSRNIEGVAANVLWVPDCHAFVYTRISKLDSKDHLQNLHVSRFDRSRIQ